MKQSSLQKSIISPTSVNAKKDNMVMDSEERVLQLSDMGSMIL